MRAAGPVAANSPTVLAPPPGVGSPAPRGGAPRSPRHPQKKPANPLANTNGESLQSLVDRSALLVAYILNGSGTSDLGSTTRIDAVRCFLWSSKG